MIDAKTAKKNADNLNNSTNQDNLIMIESKIIEASSKGKYSVSIGEKIINETIITYLRGFGYTVSKNNGFYDQRDPQGSVSPYYVISWS